MPQCVDFARHLQLLIRPVRVRVGDPKTLRITRPIHRLRRRRARCRGRRRPARTCGTFPTSSSAGLAVSWAPLCYVREFVQVRLRAGVLCCLPACLAGTGRSPAFFSVAPRS